MRNRLFSYLPLLLCALVLQGCGQKGPLYLPADKQPPPPASEDTGEDSGEDTGTPDSQADGSL